MKNQPSLSTLRAQMNGLYRQDEHVVVQGLLGSIELSREMREKIVEQAHRLVTVVREKQKEESIIDSFMQEYDLSTPEGLLLMCLAEALLRIPDKETALALIEDKLSQADFERYKKTSVSTFVNLATWLLDLTQKMMTGSKESENAKTLRQTLQNIMNRSSRPLIHQGTARGMQILANKFILGQTIEEALKRSKASFKKGYTHSYDMLGEAAMTVEDAERYHTCYLHAIRTIGGHIQGRDDKRNPGISIKLSALHPRYEYAQRDRVLSQLTQSLGILVREAAQKNVSLTIDAEEADRLDLSLDVIEEVLKDPALKGWTGFGLAVQAYQKRATAVIDWLEALSQKTKRRLNVRLVKGAYWDSEIKVSQEMGLGGYPVYTRKSSTDLSYLVCAQKLLKNPATFYPQFATHNAHTISSIIEMAAESKDFEFQRLQGMGAPLYDQIVGPEPEGYLCRIYAPVGKFQDLLPYLVRRLLENGANSSFIHHLYDTGLSLEDLNKDPFDMVRALKASPHPKIPVPRDLYGSSRENGKGVDFSNTQELEPFLEALRGELWWEGGSIINGKLEKKEVKECRAPFDHRKTIGKVGETSEEDMRRAFDLAEKGFEPWHKTSAEDRAACLRRLGDLMTRELSSLAVLCVYEGGKTLPDALAEVREAIDFCRYYADEGMKTFGEPLKLPGPTGEENQLYLKGRGVFVCISPWNFPLAIFTGQVVAALMAGNTVLAKPSGKTPLVAARAVQLMLEAGIPGDALQLVVGKGSTLSKVILENPRLGGVAFTGSTETAWRINQTLAAKRSAIVPFIAETGGQNVMLVDASALPEQVVQDVIHSAFQSAGQRCSALRILCLQEDVADGIIQMLKGAMAELRIGDPSKLETDVGPVIDEGAAQELKAYCDGIKTKAKLIYECELDLEDTGHGTFVPPIAFEIDNFEVLQGEKFGPILHVIRYKAEDLDKMIDQINELGFGLTFGLHTRLDNRMRQVRDRIKVGNMYVNRNMIGAVVGVQPFGGQGLSGTGPKAGGPFYLHRFATEQTVSIDTTAQGGNANLLTLEEK